MSFTKRTARRDHQCRGCDDPIYRGEAYVDERRGARGRNRSRWHRRCWAGLSAERRSQEPRRHLMRCAKAQRNEAMTAARLALGLSQLEVADKIGMMGPNYNIYESNNPKALVVKKDGGLTLHALRIADFYGLSPAALWPLDVLLPPLPPEPQWNALDLAAAGLVPSESPMADARSRSRERVWLIELTLATLKPREEDVLRRRFGFDLDHHESHKEIGKRWSLSHSRIQQIERKALRKLRHPLRVRKLRALYPTP